MFLQNVRAVLGLGHAEPAVARTMDAAAPQVAQQAITSFEPLSADAIAMLPRADSDVVRAHPESLLHHDIELVFEPAAGDHRIQVLPFTPERITNGTVGGTAHYGRLAGDRSFPVEEVVGRTHILDLRDAAQRVRGVT